MRRTIQTAALVGWSMAGLILTAESQQRVQVRSTEHLDFPQNGVLRLEKSFGELTIVGEDRSDVEITTVKSLQDDYAPLERERATREMGRVRVSHERHGNELVIATAFPKRPGAVDFYVEYSVKVPRSARLIVDHRDGEVHVENVSGEIHMKSRRGEITLRLPQTGHYAIDEASNFGSVTSDFPGREKRKFWLVGHQMKPGITGPSQSLHVRIGYGDILILRERVPSLVQ